MRNLLLLVAVFNLVIGFLPPIDQLSVLNWVVAAVGFYIWVTERD